MAENTLSSAHITKLLHPIFDEQIMNYGAYNLVFVTGSAIYRNADIAQQQSSDQRYFIMGYRDNPHEVIVAPLSLPEAKANGTPTSIDNTNAMRVYAVNDETLGLESTNGSSFIVRLAPKVTIETLEGSGELDQSADVEDFTQFLVDTWLEDQE